MWPKWLPNSRGLDLRRENRLLREQNDLLRLLLKQQGVTDLPSRPTVAPADPPRRRTEQDITRVTRQSISAQQQVRAERVRLSALNDVTSPPNPSSTSEHDRGSRTTPSNALEP